MAQVMYARKGVEIEPGVLQADALAGYAELYNWLRVSIRLGAARLDERLGWEEMAAAKRAMR